MGYFSREVPEGSGAKQNGLGLFSCGG